MFLKARFEARDNKNSQQCLRYVLWSERVTLKLSCGIYIYELHMSLFNVQSVISHLQTVGDKLTQMHAAVSALCMHIPCSAQSSNSK